MTLIIQNNATVGMLTRTGTFKKKNSIYIFYDFKKKLMKKVFAMFMLIKVSLTIIYLAQKYICFRKHTHNLRRLRRCCSYNLQSTNESHLICVFIGSKSKRVNRFEPCWNEMMHNSALPCRYRSPTSAYNNHQKRANKSDPQWTTC